MVWIAKLDTSSFEFMAAGATKEEAMNALRKGFMRHLKQRDAPRPHRWADWEDGVWVMHLAPGTAIRDGDDGHPIYP
jgi:hypothetical protein